MKTTALRLGKAQLIFVVVAVFLILPAVLLLAFPADLELWRMRYFERPGLESALGFTAGYVTLPPASGIFRPVFVITTVTPGGPFSQAGVRAGDVPLGYKHGFEVGFLGDLVSGQRTGSVTLRLLPAAAAALGRFEDYREVSVAFPPRS